MITSYDVGTGTLCVISDEPAILMPPTPEELLQEAKNLRAAEVWKLTVTTSSGNSFDANEDSQNRMARAIVGMEDTDQIDWVLADNSIVKVTKIELKEALKLAGAAQGSLWIKPYLLEEQ